MDPLSTFWPTGSLFYSHLEWESIKSANQMRKCLLKSAVKETLGDFWGDMNLILDDFKGLC